MKFLSLLLIFSIAIVLIECAGQNQKTKGSEKTAAPSKPSTQQNATPKSKGPSGKTTKNATATSAQQPKKTNSMPGTKNSGKATPPGANAVPSGKPTENVNASGKKKVQFAEQKPQQPAAAAQQQTKATATAKSRKATGIPTGSNKKSVPVGQNAPQTKPTKSQQSAKGQQPTKASPKAANEKSSAAMKKTEPKLAFGSRVVPPSAKWVVKAAKVPNVKEIAQNDPLLNDIRHHTCNGEKRNQRYTGCETLAAQGICPLQMGQYYALDEHCNQLTYEKNAKNKYSYKEKVANVVCCRSREDKSVKGRGRKQQTIWTENVAQNAKVKAEAEEVMKELNLTAIPQVHEDFLRKGGAKPLPLLNSPSRARSAAGAVSNKKIKNSEAKQKLEKKVAAGPAVQNAGHQLEKSREGSHSREMSKVEQPKRSQSVWGRAVTWGKNFLGTAGNVAKKTLVATTLVGAVAASAGLAANKFGGQQQQVEFKGGNNLYGAGGNQLANVQGGTAVSTVDGAGAGAAATHLQTYGAANTDGKHGLREVVEGNHLMNGLTAKAAYDAGLSLKDLAKAEEQWKNIENTEYENSPYKWNEPAESANDAGLEEVNNNAPARVQEFESDAATQLDDNFNTANNDVADSQADAVQPIQEDAPVQREIDAEPQQQSEPSTDLAEEFGQNEGQTEGSAGNVESDMEAGDALQSDAVDSVDTAVDSGVDSADQLSESTSELAQQQHMEAEASPNADLVENDLADANGVDHTKNDFDGTNGGTAETNDVAQMEDNVAGTENAENSDGILSNVVEDIGSTNEGGNNLADIDTDTFFDAHDVPTDAADAVDEPMHSPPQRSHPRDIQISLGLKQQSHPGDQQQQEN